MSRMRLMQTEGDGPGALVCLYCGAEAELRPPYHVAYCYCRSGAASAAAGGERDEHALERAA